MLNKEDAKRHFGLEGITLPFETTEWQQKILVKVADHMKRVGTDPIWVNRAASIAMFDQGTYELFLLWPGEGILKEIQESVRDWEQNPGFFWNLPRFF